jgi:hypothetical protein
MEDARRYGGFLWGRLDLQEEGISAKLQVARNTWEEGDDCCWVDGRFRSFCDGMNFKRSGGTAPFLEPSRVAAPSSEPSSKYLAITSQ